MEFQQYIWSFYGPDGVYAEFFDPPITKAEVTAAILIRKRHTKEFQWSGDSTDRELVRDIMLARRGVTELEYPIVLTWTKETTSVV